MQLRLSVSVVFLATALCRAAPAGADPAAALTERQQAVHVLNRLAFGPKPGDIDRVVRMGVARYIDSELEAGAVAYPAALAARLDANETLGRSAGALLAEYAQLQRQVAAKGEAKGEAADPKPDPKPDRSAAQRRGVQLARITLETAEARVLRAIDSPRQLEEVMVDFWFNHFNVYSGKGVDRVLLASYERDAIRPYVLGNFRQMLGATAKHPAMLFYLDNHLSTVAGYTPAVRRAFAAPSASSAASAASVASAPAVAGQRGLNENYARELMELHTLGVDGGYTQQDVTELARMFTGWTYAPRAMARGGPDFTFDPAKHDNGRKFWLGHEIAPGGQAEGEYALDLLAMHPATARHLSFQLAQYFVQDTPPPALVERMARSYLDGHGDIKTVLRTLFGSSEFMAPAALGAKFKTPYQFVISAARAGAVPVANVTPLLGAMNQLGMPLYGCQTPDGYRNTEQAWLNPEALGRRIAVATALAGRGPLDAGQLAATLDGAISTATSSVVAASPAALRAALLLGSPDFMQR